MTTIVAALKRASLLVPLLAVVLSVSVAPAGVPSGDQPVYDRFDDVPATAENGFWQAGVPSEALAAQEV